MPLLLILQRNGYRAVEGPAFRQIVVIQRGMRPGSLVTDIVPGPDPTGNDLVIG